MILYSVGGVMPNKNEKQTVFRRIGGRIVPITVGVGAIGTGHVIGSEKLFQKHILNRQG